MTKLRPAALVLAQLAVAELADGKERPDPGAYDPGTGDNWWDDRLDLDAHEAAPGRTTVRSWTRKMVHGNDCERVVAWRSNRAALA